MEDHAFYMAGLVTEAYLYIQTFAVYDNVYMKRPTDTSIVLRRFDPINPKTGGCTSMHTI